jgi:KUP system potassium uptake protein
VAKSTTQDREKLKRVLEYLNGTLDELLILGADDLTVMETWVDASYAVHDDMKSHTGGVVSFGRRAVMSKSSKQKLNVKSSTEAELVGASDYLPFAIWASKFLEYQGYCLKVKRFHQDNESTIRFEKNGRKSCGPNSRHIDIRYFFIKDRLDAEGFQVRYCPTEQMLADFFTKPLQGALFRRLRSVVMGHEHISSLSVVPPSSAPQERVGEIETEARESSVGGTAEGWTEVTRPKLRSSIRKVGGEPTNAKKVTYADVTKQRAKIEEEPRGTLYCNNPIVRR